MKLSFVALLLAVGLPLAGCVCSWILNASALQTMKTASPKLRLWTFLLFQMPVMYIIWGCILAVLLFRQFFPPSGRVPLICAITGGSGFLSAITGGIITKKQLPRLTEDASSFVSVSTAISVPGGVAITGLLISVLMLLGHIG